MKEKKVGNEVTDYGQMIEVVPSGDVFVVVDSVDGSSKAFKDMESAIAFRRMRIGYYESLAS